MPVKPVTIVGTVILDSGQEFYLLDYLPVKPETMHDQRLAHAIENVHFLGVLRVLDPQNEKIVDIGTRKEAHYVTAFPARYLAVPAFRYSMVLGVGVEVSKYMYIPEEEVVQEIETEPSDEDKAFLNSLID